MREDKKMGKQIPKMSARVVTAIRNLREARGSTSKEIMNYIKSQYNGSELSIQKQMNAALKRGLEYGILKKTNGHYFLNADVDMQQLVSSLPPLEKSRRRRRRSSRRRRGRGRRRRSRRRSRGRRRSAKRGFKHDDAKQLSCGKCRHITKKAEDIIQRNNQTEEEVQEDDATSYKKEVNVTDPDTNADRQSVHSKSAEPSLTGSQTSSNSDQEMADDGQPDLVD